MARFEVRLGRTVADTLKAYVVVDAADPAAAEAAALAALADDPDAIRWEFDQCGDTVGEDSAEVVRTIEEVA